MNPSIADFIKLLAQIAVERHYEEITKIRPVFDNKNTKRCSEMSDKVYKNIRLDQGDL